MKAAIITTSFSDPLLKDVNPFLRVELSGLSHFSGVNTPKMGITFQCGFWRNTSLKIKTKAGFLVSHLAQIACMAMDHFVTSMKLTGTHKDQIQNSCSTPTHHVR